MEAEGCEPLEGSYLQSSAFSHFIMNFINRDTHKEIIANLNFDAPSCSKNRLRFLTLKQLVTLLGSSLESVALSAIID